MTIELHHFFILTHKPDALAAGISGIGLVEGSPNDHPGQGSSNRRFFLSNSTLEILYLRDADEASRGRAKGLRLVERQADPEASPFGLVVASTTQSESTPFPGWRYHPEYFGPELFFHVGANSDSIGEPLCILMPPGLTMPAIPSAQQNPSWKMTSLQVSVAPLRPSPPLEAVSRCRGVSLKTGEPARMEITFNHKIRGRTLDLAPDFPLILHW